MFRPQVAKATSRLRTNTVAIRCTATYKYRTYGDADGPNYHIVHHLTQEMQRAEVSGANPYKVRAFATAIKAIHELDYPITKSTHVKDIPGIGEGISRRILEIIGAHRKKDFRNITPQDLEEQKKSRAMQELQRINGIGPIKSRALVESGCMSLKQLHEERFFKTLSKVVQASLTYEQDIGARVTRQQAEAFMTSMCEIIPSEMKPHLVGSYRRGKPDSSDIDILLFHDSYTSLPTYAPADGTDSNSRHGSSNMHTHPPPTLLQDTVIHPLTQKGVIVSALSGGASRWQGLAKIRLENEEVTRRLDMYLMPQPSQAAAFLALTGDTHFNLDCRKRAKSKGMHLNEFGLWRPKFQDVSTWSTKTDFDDGRFYGNKTQEHDSGLASPPNDQTHWELVETPDEAALLQELDMAYIAPERRNLANLNSKEKVGHAGSTKSRRDQSSQPQKTPSHGQSISKSRLPR